MSTDSPSSRTDSRADLKKAVCEAIDANRDEIIRIGEAILRHPETGFREVRTAALVADAFEKIGLRPATGLALTGVKGRLATGNSGPSLAILGELDSLIVSDHPHADPDTGAAHACGHNAQIAGMIGAAMGLAASGAHRSLAGELVFFAVPAEEFVEVDHRLELREQGEIEFLTGKSELIRLGHFDDIDMALMIHTQNGENGRAFMAESSNGSLIKRIRFIGRAAHAGARPQAGINALNAATLAITAIGLHRETFEDDETIRIHPIITKGGDAVSVVPAEVTLETFVRGRTLEGILDANFKVDRCLRAAAMALGARVEIQTLPGYLPQRNDRRMGKLFGGNLVQVLDDESFPIGGHRTGSTDMGDVGHLMPVIHPYVQGASGIAHSKDWTLPDPEAAYLAPAKLLALTAIDLLHGDAGEAKEVLAAHAPAMSKEEYLAFCRKLFTFERYEGEKGGAT